MKTKVKKAKSLLSILLVFLFSINGFAAIVSDNDGSTFVTKAEFESLKKSFNKQISDYNTSIDSKIDGAIASYLAGIKLTVVPENLFDRFKESSELPDVVFINAINQGTSTQTTEVEYNFTRHYTYKYCSNVVSYWKCVYNGNEYLQHLITYSNNGDWPNPSTVQYYYAKIINGVDWSGGWRDIFGSQCTLEGINAGEGTATTAFGNQSAVKSDIPTSGSGSGWWVTKYNSTCYTLDYFCNKVYPKQLITANFHSYMDVSSIANKVVDGGLGDTHTTTQLTKAIAKNTKWKSVSDGSIGSDDDTTDTKLYSNISQFMYKDYDIGQEWGNVLLGRIDPSYVIYCVDDFMNPVVSSGTSDLSLPDKYFYNIYFPATKDALQKNTMPGGKATYYKISITPKSLKPASQIVNAKMSAIAGEEVYLGSGCPIADVVSEDTTFKLFLKLATSDATNKKIDYKVSNKKFVCGEFQTDAIKYAEGTVDLSTDTDTLDLTFDVEKKGIIWLNLVNQKNGSDAILEAVSVK